MYLTGEHFGIIIPDNLLIPIANSLKLFNWPTTSRIFPTKLLYIAMKYLSDERFPKDGGIPPVRLFIEIKSLSSFIKESSSAGIFPIRLFTMRFMNLRLEQLDKLDEISPFNVLLLREGFCTQYKWRTSFGISP